MRDSGFGYIRYWRKHFWFTLSRLWLECGVSYRGNDFEFRVNGAVHQWRIAIYKHSGNGCFHRAVVRIGPIEFAVMTPDRDYQG
jgi:hypothetical protein